MIMSEDSKSDEDEEEVADSAKTCNEDEGVEIVESGKQA